MPDEPKTLKVSVSENIKMADVPPGTQKEAILKQAEESLPPEEVEKRQKIMLEYTRLSGRYVEPHNIESRWVTIDDLSRIIVDGKDMVAMCNLPRGKYSGIAALAHPQIDNKNPLRFFVLPNGMVIINPVIINHTGALVDRKEGCMSYPERDIKENVPRFNKITAIYQTLEKVNEGSEPMLSKPITQKLDGGMAHVFQHEIDHLNGQYVYNIDFDPEKCAFLGDGRTLTEDEIKELYN